MMNTVIFEARSTMILNLTQHKATPEQAAAGVVDLPEQQREELVALLTFGELPSPAEIKRRAWAVAELAAQNGLGGDDGDDPHPRAAMIGGAPWLMGPLEAALWAMAIKPVYAFSMRESADQPQPDGSIRKVAVFRHAGFVDATLSSA